MATFTVEVPQCLRRNLEEVCPFPGNFLEQIEKLRVRLESEPDQGH